MEGKYCPLRMINSNKIAKVECLRKSCAWWDDFTGHCAILSISRHGGEGSFKVVRKEE